MVPLFHPHIYKEVTWRPKNGLRHQEITLGHTWTKHLRSDVKLADSCHGVSIASQLESSGLGFRIASGRNEFQSYQDVRKTSALRELAVQLKNAKTTQGRLFKSSRDSSATTMGGFYCDRAEDLFQNQLLHLLINWIRLCATHGWQISQVQTVQLP